MIVRRLPSRNDELYHYGVKGMKWHHHKYKTEDSKIKKKPKVSKEYEEELEYNSRKNVYPEQYEEDEEEYKKDRTTYDRYMYELTDKNGRSVMAKNGTPSDIRRKYADMDYRRKKLKKTKEKNKKKNAMTSEISAAASRAVVNKYQDLSIKRAKPISQEDWSKLRKQADKIKVKHNIDY